MLTPCYHLPMTANHRFTLRIPDPLYQQAQAEAQRLGISLNALLLVALDTYLQSRIAQPNPQPSASPSPADNPPATQASNRQKRRKRKKR